MESDFVYKIPLKCLERKIPLPKEITEEIKTQTNARIYTTQEYEIRRERILNTPFP